MPAQLGVLVLALASELQLVLALALENELGLPEKAQTFSSTREHMDAQPDRRYAIKVMERWGSVWSVTYLVFAVTPTFLASALDVSCRQGWPVRPHHHEE